MLARKTTREKNEYLDKLLGQRGDIEFDRNHTHPDSKKLIAEWKEFLSLPYKEQMRRRKEWDDYYISLKDSVMYALFTEQREAAAVNDWARVKDLAQQAKQMRLDGQNITVAMPNHTDVFEFDNNGWIRSYRKLNQEIKELTKYPTYVEEAREAFSE